MPFDSNAAACRPAVWQMQYPFGAAIMKNPYAVLASAAFALTGLLLFTATAAPAAERPNIVLVMADDQS